MTAQKKRKKGSKKPHSIDAHVGSRVRLRREELDMSQEVFAKKLNLTYQQVQKYEKGTNRIGASRLFKMSLVLDVPMTYFFEDMSLATRLAPFPKWGSA